MRKIASLAATLCLTLLGLASPSLAADYPTRPAKILVGFAAGGNSDLVARQIAKELSDHFHQPFVVENRAGASGVIAAAAAAKAPPDGYTLWLGAGGNLLVQAMSKSSPVDIPKDFVPVGVVARGGYVLAINPSVPARSVPELVALAKQKPGSLNYGSAGRGTPLHLSGELFKKLTATNIAHIPFSGDAPAMAALMANTIQLAFLNLPSATAQIRAGKLRALAVTGPRRSAAFPDLPTMKELGSEFEVQSWWGLTPPEIVKALNAVIFQNLQTAQGRQQIESLSVEPFSLGVEAFHDFVHVDMARYRKTLQLTGIEPE